MTYMPSSILANAAVGDRPAARASTKYMQTFQLSKPALGGTDIRTYPNAAGNLDLYTIGTNDFIYRLRRGENAAAPYQDSDLRITGKQLFLYASASGASDTPNILSLGANGQLRLAQFQAGSASYFQQETKPADATETITQFKGVRGITGNIYVNAMLNVPGANYAHLANNFFKPGTSTWAGKVWAPILGPDGSQARVLAIAMVENSTVQSAIFAIGEQNDVLFSETSDRTSALRALGLKKVTALSVVVDQNSRLNIFAVEKDTGKLLLKKEKKYQAGTIKQFDDWIYVDTSQTVQFESIFASQCFNDLLQVFGVGTDGRLWRAGQVAGAKATDDPVWNTIFPLGNKIPSQIGSKASIFTVGRDLAGYAEAYTVSAQGDLSRFWQSPSSKQWFEESVTLFRTDDQMVPVETHALELIVLDDDGMPLCFSTVSIQASFMVTLFVDGRSYRCSQLNRVIAETGATGKVVIYQKANALAAATLYVETPSTLAGAPLIVEPNSQLQEKLASLTVDDIKNAKDASGNYLLEEKYRSSDEYASSLQQITQASMQIAGQHEANNGKRINYLFTSRRNASHGFNPRLNLAAIEGTAWAIDFTSGFPQYQAMSRETVAEWKSSKLAVMGAQETGFLGVDWGNVWNGIKEGFEYIVDGITKIVVEVVEGIGRVLFEIAGKVYEAIIEFAQQAFDFVQGVWNWLKVKLNKLFEWLAFLFNFDDFVRTAEAVEHNVAVLLDFTAAGVDQIKEVVLSGIDTMKDSLKETVDSFIAELHKQDNPNYNQFSKQQPLNDDEAYQMEHNLFANAYDENGGMATQKGASAVSAMSATPASGGLDGLITLLEDLANNFQFGDGKEAFEEALGFFTAIGDNPNDALNLLMSGVVKTLEAAALFTLDAAKAVIATLMDLIREVIEAVRALIFAEWEIPVVSQLYKLFTGRTLSIRMVQIISYLVAIPATLIYKLATKTAPFPDQGALDAYKNYVSVDWLKSKFGIATERQVVFDAKQETVVACVSLGIYSGAMVARILTDTLVGFLNATNLAAAGDLPARVQAFKGKWTNPQNVAVASIVLRLVTTFATTPWLIRPNIPGPQCPAGQPGFSPIIWMCQIVFGPFRGLLLLAVMPPSVTRINVSEATLSAWGIAQTTMVVWNYVAAKDYSLLPTLGLTRALTNIIPGQVTRFTFIPNIQGPYFIPMIIGEVLIVVGYLGSVGIAVWELVEIAKADDTLILEHV